MTQATSTNFFVGYHVRLKTGEPVNAWTIDIVYNGEQMVMSYKVDGIKRTLKFASKRDATLARDAMTEAGIVDFKSATKRYSEIRKICYSALLW